MSSKTLASYLMMIFSQEESDFKSANICKDIIAKGSFAPTSHELSCENAAFLKDSLEIGKSKYRITSNNRLPRIIAPPKMGPNYF